MTPYLGRLLRRQSSDEESDCSAKLRADLRAKLQQSKYAKELECDKGKAGGFSLLELVFALSILSILALSTMLAFVPVGRQSRTSRQVELASIAVKSILENVQATPYSNLLNTYPNGSESSVAGLDDGMVTINYEDTTSDPLVMQVTINWTSETGALSKTFFASKTQ